MPVVSVPEILLPDGVDMAKWATVACDQFCAEPSYWKKLDSIVGDAPSTLRITYPEIFLCENTAGRILSIHKNMEDYIKAGIFKKVNNLILVERQVGNDIRAGLMLQIDLEAYDWRRVKTPIRATEDTLVERLPVRIDIRRKAPIELPHAMILLDDSEKTVIEPVFERRNSLKKLYDFDLNMGGGRIRGYEVDNSQEVLDKIIALSDPALQIKKYGSDAQIMMAVGDGNHSIAAAKALWEEIKKSLSEKERETHPARFLLAEAVNIYGGGMRFEPIHRVVFGAGEDFIRSLEDAIKGGGSLKIIQRDGERFIKAPASESAAIKAVQEYIEKALKEDTNLKAEYIHNSDHLIEVVKESGGVGILMPAFPAEQLFSYVVNVGNLPKKAFSIGEPEQKRYYLEAKYIV